MAQNIFSINYKEIILDEIGLDGLEGTGVDLLWRRLEKRISYPITVKLCCKYWSYIIKCKDINIYENPEPLPHIEIYDRFTIIEGDSGDLKEPDVYLDGPYEYHPIADDYGSCVHYNTRTLLNKDTLNNYQDTIATYGNKLVLVASMEKRWAALSPHLPIPYLKQLSTVHYCILELVGKARENGQMTIGKTNLMKIIKDPKLLFYNRKILQDLDLIKTFHMTNITKNNVCSKGILLRLNRFHKSAICTIPKVGLVYNLVQYLKNKPNFCERSDVVMNKGLLTVRQNKRFRKNSFIFGYNQKPLTNSCIVPSKSSSTAKRRFIYLCSPSDDSSQSEEESDVLPCQYKVGVNLLRQAYERFIDAGLNGLTQIQLGQLLGIEFYVSRTICRVFRNQNIVREFLEDKGRQRTARFIATVATAKTEREFEKEKEQFKKYLEGLNKREATERADDLNTESPKKKVKLENKVDDIEHPEAITEAEVNTETSPINKSIFSLEDPSKKLTLRQLKFANGVLKVLRQNKFVVGYQRLSKLVGIEINQSPMVSKAVKTFLHGLASEGFVKIYYFKLHSPPRCSVVICDKSVKPTDPSLRAKYKEIMKVATKTNQKEKPVINKSLPNRKVTQFAYPRFLKVQKLHKVLAKFVLCDKIKSESSYLPKGFVHFKDIVLNFTVEDAIGNLNSSGYHEIVKLKIDDKYYGVKIRDAPFEISKILSTSGNLCNVIKTNLRTLALFGLVQFIGVETVDTNISDSWLSINLFYINRFATLIDTTGIWPKQNTPIQNLEKKFEFQSMEDVDEYWNTLYTISVRTDVQLYDRNQLKSPNLAIRSQSNAPLYDDGSRYGNGFGPCGFDSCYYLDLPRLWKSYVPRTAVPQKKPPSRKKVVKIPKLEIAKAKRKTVLKTKPKRQVVETSAKIQPQKKSPIKPLSASSAMARQSITWTPKEDNLLVICKVGINIMSPYSQPGSIQVRNLVAKDIVSITIPNIRLRLCNKRFDLISTKKNFLYKADCIRAVLKRDYRDIYHKYDGLLKKLRAQNSTNVKKFLGLGRLRLMELVWMILKVYKNASFEPKLLNIADIDEFHNAYYIKPISSYRFINYYISPPDDSIIGTLKEAILLTVISSDTTGDMSKVFNYFNRYDSRNLKVAIDQLRKSGAIAAKHKFSNLILHKNTLENVMQCFYKISAFYERKWSSRLNAEFADNVGTLFATTGTDFNDKGSPEINCTVFELHAAEVLDIVSISDPTIVAGSGVIIKEEYFNTFDIESKFKLKSAMMGWKPKSGTERYRKSIITNDYEAAFELILRYSLMSIEQNFDVRPLGDLEKKITTYLSTKREKGATFHDIKMLCLIETKQLVDVLTKMCEKNVISRVGVYDNFLVLFEYFKEWAMVIDNNYILPKPWISTSLEIQQTIFFKWAGVIMNEIFEQPACSITFLSNTCKYLSTAATQDICEVLNKWGCILLKTGFLQETDLFSDPDDLTIDISDYNEFESPKNIIACPVKDSLVRYAYIRNSLLNRSFDLDS